ncbi:uncharacterized protein LOC127811475 [Diospyros lotus]|uniref:uncharacterized protein LOC127811475 n=1 Tax=Diospyros lotus TaxID=55363 RepID=UPI002252E104|nr:uncharacterized protein LOC127811475 [Diospyros lotus]
MAENSEANGSQASVALNVGDVGDMDPNADSGCFFPSSSFRPRFTRRSSAVSIAIFNQASKVTIFPLVSITTSFVAEEDTVGRIRDLASEEENVGKTSAQDNEMKQLMLCLIWFSFALSFAKNHASFGNCF